MPRISAARYLRSATRDAHDEAEASPVMRDLFETGIDMRRYGNLLLGLHGMYRSWEGGHQPFIERLANEGRWHYQSRTLLLKRDLAALDMADVVRPMTSRASFPSGAAANWGMLYVIEGSALGGRLISARLRSLFPHRDAFGYFAVGTDDGGRWPRFQAVLDEALVDEFDLQQAVLGARAFFVAFRQALNEV